MKIESVNIIQFVESCFTDCESMPAIIFRIACKLIVFSIMVSVVGYWLVRAFGGEA